ncbi:MAG: tetratricopeptide repeat protein, partial [Candidatus Polarisedimenticolia bacterium]
CLFLPAALLLGAALPLAPVAALAKGRSPARMALYLALGVVLAEVLTRPFIIPAFGLRRTAALAAAVAVLAALLFLGFTRFQSAATRQTAGMVLIGLMCVAGFYPASWDPRLVASGLYRYGARSLERFGSAGEYLAARQRLELIFFREGRESGVIVERSAQTSATRGAAEALALTVDGKIEATTGADLRTQVLQAHLPLLVHGTPRDVLLVDLLDGVAAGSILRHPIESLTVVEREPAMIEAAAAFAPYNGLFDESGRVADGRVRLVHDEARPWLLRRREAYDVILISGFDPWRAHSAALTTEEGLTAIRSRLREGGVAAQRLALTAVSGASLRTVMRTFVRVFPSVLLFQISSEDLLLVGSERELALDVGWLKNVISSRGEIAEDLRRILVFGPNEILLTFRLGGEGVRGLAGKGPIDRDDLALVETAAVRDMRVHDGRSIVAALEARWTPLAPVITNYGGRPGEKAEFLYGLAKVYLGMAGDPRRARELGQEILGLGRPAPARWVMGESLLQERDIDGALAEWEGVLDVEPGNLDALFSLGTFHLDNRDYWKADAFLAKAARLFPDTAVVRYHNGRNLFYLGRNEAAIKELREAARMAGERESYPLVPYLVGVAANKLKRDGEARESLEGYLKLAYTQPLTRVEVDAHMKLAEVYERQGQRFQAHRERQKGEELRRRIEAQTLRARQEGSSVPEAVAPPPGGPDSLGLPPEVGGIGPGETVRPQPPPKP